MSGVGDRFRKAIGNGICNSDAAIHADDMSAADWDLFADGVASDALKFIRDDTSGNTHKYLRMLVLRTDEDMEDAIALKEIIYSEVYADIADRLYRMMKEDEYDEQREEDRKWYSCIRL